MKLCPLVLYLILASAGHLVAQDSACVNAPTTQAQRECLSQQLKITDSGLEALVDSLKGTLKDSSRAALARASDQWLAYRAAECDAVLKSFDGGSMGLIENLSCYIALADSRQKYLRSFYSAGDE